MTVLPNSWSLLKRLVFGFAASFLVLFVVSYLVLYYLLASGLESQRNIVLQDRIETISSLLKSPVHGLEEIRQRVEKEWPIRGGEKVYVKIIDGQNKVAVSTPDIPVIDNLPSILMRSISVDNSVGLSNPVTIQVAVGYEQGQSFLRSFRETMLITVLVSIMISLAVGWQIARSGMRPLELISQTVRGIGTKNLHERVSTKSLPVELHELALAFNETLDRLEDSFERLSRFSSDIAHELRTPVTNIKGEMEIALARPRSDAEYRENLSSTLEECSRLMLIMDSLFFLARAENIKQDLKRESISIRQMITEIIDFFEPSAAEKDVQIEFLKSSPADLVLQVESVLLQRALGNLVANAIQYTGSGGRVEVFYQVVNSSVLIKVKDNGFGIPEDSLANIFDRFYRVDSSRNHNSGGIGLGLAIVKSIIDLHGGAIRVESILDTGTEFTIRLPC